MPTPHNRTWWRTIRAIAPRYKLLFGIGISLVLAPAIYEMWYRGNFAFSHESKLRSLARQAIFYQSAGKSQNLLLLQLIPFYTWSFDETILPRIQESSGEIVPYLEEELHKDPERKSAAEFMLTHVVKTPAALALLVREFAQENVSTDSLRRFLGPSVFARPVEKAACSSRYNFRDYVPAWFDAYRGRLVATRYGTGIRMPDNTVRPLGFYGVIHDSGKPTYFFPGICYFHYGTDHTMALPELSSYIYYTNRDRWAESRRLFGTSSGGKPKIIEENPCELFEKLFDEAITSDTTFWPFYPIFSGSSTYILQNVIIGYKDRNHQRHGPWTDLESGAVQWYFHGTPVEREVYYARGGYDMEISLCDP
ncbi:MAG: hypothetical protein LIP77_07380 [Planctomycetes bacterium]|nr:hypothetical protein [Planctomycetota bacterium]